MAYTYADDHRLRADDPGGLAVTSTVTGTGADGQPITGGPVNARRSNRNADLHAAVVAALPLNNAREGFADGGDPIPATHCGDMHAFSDYLNQWENSHNPPRRCDPATPAGRANLDDALSNVSNLRSEQTGGSNPGTRAPCPNCSQSIQRLYGLAGLSPPDASVITRTSRTACTSLPNLSGGPGSALRLSM